MSYLIAYFDEEKKLTEHEAVDLIRSRKRNPIARVFAVYLKNNVTYSTALKDWTKDSSIKFWKLINEPIYAVLKYFHSKNKILYPNMPKNEIFWFDTNKKWCYTFYSNTRIFPPLKY